MMKLQRQLGIAAIALALTVGAGCVKKTTTTTSQYQVAVANDRASVVLNVLCKQEINFKSAIPVDVHKTIAQKCLQAATLDDQITNAVAAGDFKSASSYLDLTTTAVQSIGADLLSIKDPTTQQALQIAQTAVIGALQAWKAALQVSAPSGAKGAL